MYRILQKKFLNKFDLTVKNISMRVQDFDLDFCNTNRFIFSDRYNATNPVK